jgi:hypothetical protein
LCLVADFSEGHATPADMRRASIFSFPGQSKDN